MSETSTLEMDIDSESQDGIVRKSSIDLHGNILVRFINGFTPDGYWSRSVILTEQPIDTDQLVINLPQPSPGLVNRYFHTGIELFIGQTCLADIDLSGAVNFFDISIFLGYFTSENEFADLNHDGHWNFFDVSMFLLAFSSECQ